MSKRSQQLFQFLVKISDNLEQSAATFSSGLTNLSQRESLAQKMKEFEEIGDKLTSELVVLLNATYITPIEREDFVKLSLVLDDIADGLEAVSVRFDLYDIREATPAMVKFAENIQESVAEIKKAILLLQSRKLVEIREHTKKLNSLEKVGDNLLRNSLRLLFADQSIPPLAVVKCKEIYEILAHITDKCEDVGDVLDSVIVKNA